MSVSALIQGTLAKPPESRISKSGNAFTMATLKVSSGNEAHFWRLFVFSESAQAELQRLGEGDALACQGTPKFELYRPESGEPRVSLSMTADHVLALRQPPKERTKKDPAPAASPALPLAPAPSKRAPQPGGLKSRCGAPAAGLDDEIPF